MEFDEDAPLAQSFNRKRKSKKQPEARPEQPPPSARPQSPTPPPEIALDYSVDNHFKAVDTIAKLCGRSDAIDQAEIERFSDSITFLREWSDFNYAPRTVRFANQRNLKEKDVIGDVTLHQFSATSVPKKEMGDESEAGVESSKDFVMYVGGAVWALDWCPRVNHDSDNLIKSEFVAVAAHPPESSYHKIGAPLTGRGAIQIWCLVTVSVKDVPNPGNKKSRLKSEKKVAVKSNEPTKPLRPRGRPRKKSLNDPVEMIDKGDQYVQPLAIEYPESSNRLRSSNESSANSHEHVYDEDSLSRHKGSNQTEHANPLLLTAPKGRGSKAKARKQQDQDLNNGSYIPSQCENREAALVNTVASASFTVDSPSSDKNISYSSACDVNDSKNTIPTDVALPRLMLCLAHNGKVAWDVKWRPVNASNPESMHAMGYLAVLLGSGALEVWEVPLPHTVKLVYPACQEGIDPRFIKLKPVFRCSKLKCGDRQSIPLTVEWSVSSSHDMILAGCHDGVVALWKFSVTDSLTETRPLLSFSADTSPIRTLAWAPIQGDLESANVFVTAGHKGLKFWDLRDPFRPLREYPLQGTTFGFDWLQDIRCVFGALDDGTLWLINLEKAAHDIPVTGKCLPATTKLGFHSFDCSSFSIWSIQSSRLTGMVAYCGEEGTTLCFKPTTRSVRDPSRNRVHHYLCGSLSEEGPALIIASPATNTSFPGKLPSMKRSGGAREQENKAKGHMVICGNDSVEEHGSENSSKSQALKSKQSGQSELKSSQETLPCKGEIENFPPKVVAMHRVRWNVNKGSEKWLCYGGASGLVRCQEVDFSVFQ